MLDICYLLSKRRLPRDEATCLYTLSGGAGVQMADFADEAGLPLPVVPQAVQDTIRALIPAASVTNPVDITAQITQDPTLFTRTLTPLADLGTYGTLVSFLSTAVDLPGQSDVIRDSVAALQASHPDLLHILVCTGRPETIARLDALGCPVFEEPDRAIRALAGVVRLMRQWDAAPVPQRSALQAPVHPAPGALNEDEAKTWLAGFGLPRLGEAVAGEAQEAVRAAEALGYPVALKVLSRDIAHKSDVGGVRLNIMDGAAVAEALRAMSGALSRAVPGAGIEGYLVSGMAPDGTDCILGAHLDPVFGPVVMFGLGGIFVEVFEDVVFRQAPVGPEDARAMIGEIRGRRLLEGYRGQLPADVEALVQAIVALGRAAEALGDRLVAVEVNPFRVFSRGTGAAMLDAVVETQTLGA